MHYFDDDVVADELANSAGIRCLCKSSGFIVIVAGMAGFWRELWPRLPQWPCLASRCASSSADHIGTKTEAESRNDEAGWP